MRSSRLVSCFIVAGLMAIAVPPQFAQSPAPAAPQAPASSPTGAQLWDDKCAGCHAPGGRGPNLFDAAWLGKTDDVRMTSRIKSGVGGTEMPPFAGALTDVQVFQLIAHIRRTTGLARPAPPFVPKPDGTVVRSEKQAFRVELVADGLMTPWALEFLPDGRLLITERAGRLRIVDHGTLTAPVSGTPTAHEQQDGGYLDVALHPDYARNKWIYLAYAEDRPGAPAAGLPPEQIPSMTVIVRGRINDRNEWIDEQVIYRAPAGLYTTNGAHYGCRMIFDRQNHLFFTLGERGNTPNAQDLTTPLGKIHRVNDDGSVVKDNPFVATPGAVPTIWSYGHRNPEGLAWDPVSGILWETEHGPNQADEINIVEKGHNYGWAVASKSGQPGLAVSLPGMDDPIVYFIPTYAPAGITFYTGDRYPKWKNTSLFVGGLRGQAIRRLEIKGREVIRQEVIFNQFGRVRDIAQSPDGYFYVALQDPTGVPDPATGVNSLLSASTPGRVVRLMPIP